MISQLQFSSMIDNIIKLSNTKDIPLENIMEAIEEIFEQLSPESFINFLFNDYERERRNLMDFKAIGYLMLWAEAIKQDHIEDVFKAERHTNKFAFNFPLLLLNIFNLFKDEKKYALQEGFEENDNYIQEVEKLMDKTKSIMDEFVLKKE